MKIIAHRGHTEEYPENTLIAFKNAKSKNADAVELDVHLSEDKKLIVHHDYNLKNPTGGDGLIAKTQSSYIKTLEAGSWFNPKFSSEKIPFLEEVFVELKDTIHYEIELKGYTKEFVSIVMDLIKQYNLVNNIELTSPHQYILTYLKETYSSIKTGAFIQPLPEWMDQNLGKEIILNNMLMGKIDVAHLPLSLLTSEYVTAFKKEGILVHVANCDSEKDIKRAFDLQVDQISTNMLNLALSIRESYE